MSVEQDHLKSLYEKQDTDELLLLHSKGTLSDLGKV